MPSAFDCVSDGLLIDNFKYYKSDVLSVGLISSYLSNRKQFVRINNKSSDTNIIKDGVPQGSVVGPVLFLIYINDIEMGTRAQPVLFADDISFSMVDASMDSLLQEMGKAQAKAEEWFAVNSLKLNNNKTKHFYFTFKNLPKPNDQDSVKMLGFYMDQKLTWAEHVEYTTSKLNQNLFVIRSLTNIPSTKVALTAYHALIMSHCTYGLILWGHAPDASDIFGIQRKALRIVFNIGLM